MRSAIVIEKAQGNYSAYVPDLPACVATAAKVAEVEAEIREAIAFHVEGLREDGLTVMHAFDADVVSTPQFIVVLSAVDGRMAVTLRPGL